MKTCVYCNEQHEAGRTLSFDGFGINGCGIYRSRIASIPPDYRAAFGPLFAAAPDLLAACKAALPALAAHEQTGCDCPDSEAARLIRAAIARAESRAE